MEYSFKRLRPFSSETLDCPNQLIQVGGSRKLPAGYSVLQHSQVFLKEPLQSDSRRIKTDPSMVQKEKHQNKNGHKMTGIIFLQSKYFGYKHIVKGFTRRVNNF